ncbi:HMG-Y-related protein B [Vitis vinifera]|nr:HMG-Y-related protein B [Vitis vinifera]
MIFLFSCMTVILAHPPPPFSLRHAMHPKPSRFSMAMHGHFLPIPQPPSSILQHLETTMAAIEALNDKSGSSKSFISKHIESAHGDLPAAHSTLLMHHLNRRKQNGDPVMVRNHCMKPDPNAPPRKGRGRPPEPEFPLPPGTVLAPPRPRCHPLKPRDPFALVSPPKKASSGSGKPRGRPPEKPKVGTSSAPAPATGASRPRGWPPKAKPAVVPVGWRFKQRC